MFLKEFFRQKHFYPLPGPELQKQEPYITGANLERADWYLKLLKTEKDRLHAKWRADKSTAPLFVRTLVRYEGARTMYSILTSSDEVSEEICRKVCGGEWKEDM